MTINKCEVCGGDVEVLTGKEGTSCYLPINRTTDQELLKLIYDDLKMRSDDGVIDLSNFIWQRLSKRVKANP